LLLSFFSLLSPLSGPGASEHPDSDFKCAFS
jgi:hypothetical protein